MTPELRVRDAMTGTLFAVAPDTSLVTAARLFALHHVTGAPVIDEGCRPIGVISQSDLVDPERPRTGRFGRPIYYRVEAGAVQEVSDEGPISDGIVAHAMSPFVLAIAPDSPVSDAARLMVAENVHRLMVIERGRLAGIITTMDVLRAVAREARV
jgi:CBS domain-containing protein